MQRSEVTVPIERFTRQVDLLLMTHITHGMHAWQGPAQTGSTLRQNFVLKSVSATSTNPAWKWSRLVRNIVTLQCQTLMSVSSIEN